MKKSISFFLFVFSFFTLISVNASEKNQRSLKVSLFSVGTFSKAKKFSLNYGLKILSENSEWGKSELVAYNPKTGEGVSYFFKYVKSANRIVEFCYYNVGNKSESEIRFYEDEVTIMLKNSYDTVKYTSSSYWMPANLYQSYTDLLVIQREVMKEDMAKKYGMKFFDEINPNQTVLRKEKTANGCNLFIERHAISTEK